MSLDLSRERILLTGGAGFLGSFVLEELVRSGARPEAIRVPRSATDDLREPAAARRCVEGCSVVIHLAANVGGIGYNREHPADLAHDNLLMGIHVLDAARAAGVRKFVQVGTLCAYPKFTPVPFREEDLWNGYPEETNAPYGLAKKMLLVYGRALADQHGFPFIYLLPTNLYGPRDCFEWERSHVIPALVRKCVEAVESGTQRIEAWGDGTPTREFLYVEDAARAIVLATRLYEKTDPVNLGSGEEISILDLAGRIAAACGFRGELVWNPRQPNGQPRRRLDTTRAAQEFGFRAQVAIEAGIPRTVEWFRGHRG